MRKFITCAALALAVAGLALAPAVASAGYEAGDPYLDRYLEISANPNPDAQCGTGAGSGAFGYFGKGYDLGHPQKEGDAKGASGYQTGLNNSAVCGNRP